MMQVKHQRKHEEDQQVDQADDAQAEEEGVALKVAELQEAQDEAGRPTRAPLRPRTRTPSMNH